MIQESSFKSILSVSMLSGIVTQNPSYNWLRAHSHIWINPKTTNSNESKSFTWQNIANLNMNTRSSWHNQKTIRTSIKGVRASYSRPNYAHIGHQELIGRLNLIITMWRCTSQFVVRFGSQMHAATCTQCLSFALAKCPSHPSNVHRVYTWGCDFGQVGFVTDAHLNHACNYWKEPKPSNVPSMLYIKTGPPSSHLHIHQCMWSIQNACPRDRGHGEWAPCEPSNLGWFGLSPQSNPRLQDQCPGRFFGQFLGRDPRDSKSNRLHVDIFQFFFMNLGHIL